MSSTTDLQPLPPGTSAALDDLIACPSCDALYRVEVPKHGERAVCARCHHVLIAPIQGAILRIVALSLTILVLLITAIFQPFLKIEAAGLSHSSSIVDAALSFSEAHMIGLSVAVLALIVFIPIARALLLIFSLGPLLLHRPALRGARSAFRWAEAMRPWSMAEIFVLGVGVALVKIVDMARVELGLAFWMFAALVVITVLQDGFMCRWSVWAALDSGHPDPFNADRDDSDAETGLREEPGHG
ncbi:paraquat-inducible protein A [Aliiruegeria haliotis]|uniref:Paraquat-inducible protein A n=1 Tax=Aliiruegeria haliotis TaxID=1280846 RepID=A0A2T0RSP1_9RHOB|nr:paraquat-inducible protein A [Aliiruegeria haliotis]PRY24188.1 paraquat-inducible protein A [Aliiruegeria haliotis]